jgi:hypothetical protein
MRLLDEVVEDGVTNIPLPAGMTMQQPRRWLNTTIKKHVNELKTVLMVMGNND